MPKLKAAQQAAMAINIEYFIHAYRETVETLCEMIKIQHPEWEGAINKVLGGHKISLEMQNGGIVLVLEENSFSPTLIKGYWKKGEPNIHYLLIKNYKAQALFFVNDGFPRFGHTDPSMIEGILAMFNKLRGQNGKK